MIEVHALTKRFGARTAVDDLSFTVQPGRVTGFLGPNGAGKSTTMRVILGLDRPTQGWAVVNGRPFADHPWPMRTAGALLDPKAAHPRRAARSHLLALAATVDCDVERVEEVLAQVGLTDVADQRAGDFSLGMSQRLGLAGALLGDPDVLILDEPVNGLDPDGVRWMRTFLKALADQGRTVLLSSHLMSEMSQTADHLIIIGKGRLIADVPTSELLVAGQPSVRARTLEPLRLQRCLETEGAEVDLDPEGYLTVRGVQAETVGRIAAQERVTLTELTPVQRSLEEAFIDLTAEAIEYGTSRAEKEAPL